ncbi:hypothetical protein [Bdellovibrio sp. GT3]|uniref:hypothetical protein n=1 Tax=Bdellovibrio sp. GT3 TaxID=3136282 RepID=UPI0030F03E6C
MKQFLALSAMTLLVSFNAAAHDEGHGPKLADTGKYGGLVSAVVAKVDASKGTKATLVHKAELVRSADGNVSVYIYDQDMKPLDIKSFDAKGSASLAAKVKGKWKTTTFDLAAKDKSFEGKMPKPEGKPYNIDVTIKENGKELLSAFDNLD